jgi:hypothetical protein
MDETLIIAILLNNVDCVSAVINLCDFRTITKQQKYKNAENKLTELMIFAKPEFVSIKKFFDRDTYDKTYLKYVSEIVINMKNVEITKLLLDKNLLCVCEYPTIGDDQMTSFDLFFDVCLNDKKNIIIAFNSLYRGMKLICTNGLNEMSKTLKASRHITTIIPTLYMFCKFKNYGYGKDALKKHHAEICDSVDEKFDSMMINNMILEKCLSV